jgi:hypothetical protein
MPTIALTSPFVFAAPLDGYMSVPGVITTGPFNQHFLRDIGLIFQLNSFAFAVGTTKPEYRRALWCSRRGLTNSDCNLPNMKECGSFEISLPSRHRPLWACC